MKYFFDNLWWTLPAVALALLLLINAPQAFFGILAFGLVGWVLERILIRK